MLKEVRCGNCARLLAKSSPASEIQIKCPRCGTINHQKAVSLQEAPRAPLTGGSHDTTHHSVDRR